ncbi:HGGxSTG domain-containing protein [Novosphingobium sp. 28-62-57]|uniref:HGGxSTG domain-containing protein n=1 Tax=Novosphingobium sp. 28-62-57 TaxID=1970409 RepID=UPI00345BC822
MRRTTFRASILPVATACQSPAVNGAKRCRMHGGKGIGAPEGNRNAWRYGRRSAYISAAVRYMRELAQQVREMDR